MALAPGLNAVAQVTIDTDTTAPVSTSTADNGNPSDIVIDAAGSVTITTGTAVTIDSDNSVTNSGDIITSDADDTIGVNLIGGNAGDFTNTANIRLDETFTPDNQLEGPIAEGSGRTGILISGTSSFKGNIDLRSGGSVAIEGNDSFAVRLLEDAGLLGDFMNEGQISISGANTVAVSLDGNVTGGVTNNGSITTRGENTAGIVINGDVTGQFSNGGRVSNSGYRFSTRPSASGIEQLNEDDFLQAASAIGIHGNITNGIYLRRVIETTENDDGTTTERVSSRSNITQFGNAPAVLIGSEGSPVTVGVVADITDPDDENFDADLQYAFINEGVVTSSGVYDDVNATAVSVSGTTLEGGLRNSGSLSASTVRSGDNGEADTASFTGTARAIAFGKGVVAEEIDNSGFITAQVREDRVIVYADPDSPLEARDLEAYAIDIDANANVQRLINSGSISALLSGRSGQAFAIRDGSGTLTGIENTGLINAFGTNSDPLDEELADFDLIAIDLSRNTTGTTITQLAAVDMDPDDDNEPADPAIAGDVILGSGDDTVSIRAGSLTGALAFGSGDDSFTLSGGSTFEGKLTNAAGGLVLAVSGGSTLTNTSAEPLNVTSASFDGASIFRPTLDGSTGKASGIMATESVLLADGAKISPILQNIIGSDNSRFVVLQSGGDLGIPGGIGNVGGTDTLFLYDFTYSYDAQLNAVVVDLDLRDAAALGLDHVQTAAFDATIEALRNNTDLANALVNIGNQSEFNNAYSQLLPEFAAAAPQFVLANVDGAVGAVGTHLDNTRLSTARSGGIWLQEFGYFADRDLAGLSEQYRGYGFGITGGLDTAFGPFHTVGFNIGFASTEIEDVVGFDEPMDVTTIQLGGYIGYTKGALGIEGYVGGGSSDFGSARQITIGTFTDEVTAKWSGTHVNASLRAGYDLPISKRFFARPVISVDYLNLKEEGYQESGATGIALNVDGRTSRLGGATAMLNLGRFSDNGKTWFRPVVRIGYRNEFINNGIITDYGFVGLTERTQLENELFPTDAILVGFSIAAGSGYSSIGFDFDSDIRDGFIRHTGRLVVRLIF